MIKVRYNSTFNGLLPTRHIRLNRLVTDWGISFAGRDVTTASGFRNVKGSATPVSEASRLTTP
jgi:hypothetical protein